MSEEMVTNLSSYRLQLQQVENAIAADADNQDLPKLKLDLQEMITLTESLVGTNTLKKISEHKWKNGDRCKAIWSKDKQYYPARIGEVLEDDTCSVIFDKYELTEVVDLTTLRTADADDSAYVSKSSKARKDHSAAGLEQKRKRFLKKALRLKEHEDEREKEKNKWKQFNNKCFSKTNKGRVKKSIFASPDQSDGMVGVGTCGHAGRPMTKIKRLTKP